MSRFFCPHCEKSFRWDPAIAGKKGNCKACGKPMTVPTQGTDLRKPEPSDSDVEIVVEEETPVPKPRPIRREATSSASSLGPRPIREKNKPPSAKKAPKTTRSLPTSKTTITATSILTVVLTVIFFAAKVYRRYDADQARAENRKSEQLANHSPVTVPALEISKPPEILEPKLPLPNLARPGENRGLNSPVDAAKPQMPAIPPTEPPKATNNNPPTETPKPGSRGLAPGETLFELFDAVIVERQQPNAFALSGGAPDFSISVRYRIRPVDEVLNVHVYQLNLRIDNNDNPVGFDGKLTREGIVQSGFRSFGGGLDRRVVGDVQAWVEKIDPDNTANVVRVSNIVTLARAGSLPQAPPPAIEDPNVPPLRVDTTLPPAMQERMEKFKRELQEKERPFEGDEIDAGLAQMAAERDQFKVREQLKRLQKTAPDASKQNRVDATLAKLLTKGDSFTVKEVLATWRIWESDRLKTALVEALSTDDSFSRSEIIKTIGEMKVAEATEELVRMAQRSRHDHDIERALVEIGPSAEPEVAKLLSSDERDDVRFALKVLEEIGTKKSMKEVVRLTKHEDPFVRMAAEGAAREIKERE